MQPGRIIFLISLFFSCYFCIHAQDLPKSALKHLSKNAISINVSDNYKKADWSKLIDEVRDKKIILLGEFTHGAGEVFTARNSLIQALHETLNCNVILFESGIGELAAIEFNKDQLNADQLISGFFSAWRNQPFKALMNYVKTENIHAGGYDVQRTGRSFQPLLYEVAHSYQLDSTLVIKLEQRFGQVSRILTNRSTKYEDIQSKTVELIEDYQLVAASLSKQQPANQTTKQLLVIRTLRNRASYLSYMLAFLKDKDWHKRWKARDSIMAANVSWQIEQLYPNDRVIIIGHNFHISKYNQEEEVMGEFLAQQFGNQMFSLGIFAGQGSYFDNAGRSKKIMEVATNELDIKHIIQFLPDGTHFFPIPSKKKAKNEWLFNPIIINDSFIDLNSSNTLTLAKHYDGLLLIDKVSPPEK